jgi:nucleoside-diphosphate-sugar epimerase
MKVMVTGGFGNVGVCVIDECLRRGHDVTVFDMAGKRTRNIARSYGNRLGKVVYGDIRTRQSLLPAVADQDVIVHMAAILPPISEEAPELCNAVNVGGTQNLITAIGEANSNASVVFVSSVAAGGAEETNTYGLSKARAEEIVRAASMDFTILRLSAVLPTRIRFRMEMARMIFDIPLQARCEIILDLDVATAIANAIENLRESGPVAGRTYVLGGGGGCQILGSDLSEGLLTSMGLPTPAPELFTDDVRNFSLSWYDTTESQRDLRYQNHSFTDYRTLLRRRYRLVRPVIRLLAPAISSRIARLSPRYGTT